MSAALALAPEATRREWIGLAVIALPCLLYSMDLRVAVLVVVLLRKVPPANPAKEVA